MPNDYIYGKIPVLTLLENDREVNVVYLQKEYKDMKIISILEKKSYNYCYKERKFLDNLTNNANHQGIVAEAKSYQYVELNDLLKKIKKVPNPVLLMLDGIEDPHNLGAILRTVDAVNAQGIIISKHHQVGLNSTVAKVSTGAIEHVDVVQVTNLTQTLKTLKEAGFWIYGAEADGGSDFNQVEYDGPVVLIVGSEGKGISSLVLKQCDFRVKIPMNGHVNSLNVSVAAALLLYGVYLNRSKKIQ